MASVTPILTSGGLTLYEIEKNNWERPTVRTFDTRGEITLTEETILDILLLGEGYLSSERSDFESYISSWYDNTFAKWPFSQFTASFRVRAVFTPSLSPANVDGDGYFGVTLNEEELDDDGIIVKASNSELDIDLEMSEVRLKLFNLMAFVKDSNELNTRSYPEELVIGKSGDQPEILGTVASPRNSDKYSNLMRNCTIAMAIKNPSGNELSGFFGQVEAPLGHELGDHLKVNIAFGRGYQHEFSHAFSMILDEYVHERSSFATNKQNPSHLSVFEMWNLSYTSQSHMVPWFHLSPSGLHPRSSNSLVGQMWLGGRRKENGVWHSEYKCQINGGHQNYFSSTDEPDQMNGDNQVFASLRSDHFCLWCEEIITVKILEKTDAFLTFDDVLESEGDINKLGIIWFKRWADDLRSVYWTEFDLPQRIDDRELYFQNPANLDNLPYFDGDLSNTNLMKKVKKLKSKGESLLLWKG